jgi:hypothetical protein
VKERGYFENLSTDGNNLILKWVLGIWEFCGFDPSGSESGLIAGIFTYTNKYFGSVKGGAFLE